MKEVTGKELFPLNFKRRLMEKKDKLTKARLWHYVVQMRDPSFYRDDIVNSMVRTVKKDVGQLIVQHASQQLHITNMIPYVCYQLPDEKAGGVPLGRIKEPPPKIWQEIFPGGKKEGYDATTQRWDYVQAQEPWNAFFSFINRYICFEEFPTELPMTTVRMAVAAMQGIRLNWGELFLFHLKRSLLEMQNGSPGDKHLKHILTSIWETSTKQDLVTSILPISLPAQTSKEKGPPPKEKGVVQEEEPNRSKRIKMSTNAALIQEGTANAQAGESSYKETRVELQLALIESAQLVQQIVAGLADKMVDGSATNQDIVTRDLRIQELEAALRKSRDETKEIAASNGDMGRELEERTAEIRLLQRFDADHKAELQTKGQRQETLEREIGALESVVASQKEQLHRLTQENETKSTLLAEKEQEFEAERAAQDGRIAQLRARDAEEALQRQRIALSALQEQLANESQLIASLPTLQREGDARYLGAYDALFDRFSVPPFISWKAIDWMLRDYGMARRWTTPPDKKLLATGSAKDTTWTVIPPPAVALHPLFCPCERRYRWDPTATIDSVEYNWPRIPGPFYTPEDCGVAYSKFFEQHRTHHDPVCFRAAVFCAIMAHWCRTMQIYIDVNVYDPRKKEFWIFLKLHYSSSRFTRLLEAMSVSNFIAGVHHGLVDEVTNLFQPCQRFLTQLARSNYHELKADDHLFVCLKQAREWEQKRNTGQNTAKQRQQFCRGRQNFD